jgi:hypothetical protein
MEESIKESKMKLKEPFVQDDYVQRLKQLVKSRENDDSGICYGLALYYIIHDTVKDLSNDELLKINNYQIEKPGMIIKEKDNLKLIVEGQEKEWSELWAKPRKEELTIDILPNLSYLITIAIDRDGDIESSHSLAIKNGKLFDPNFGVYSIKGCAMGDILTKLNALTNNTYKDYCIYVISQLIDVDYLTESGSEESED